MEYNIKYISFRGKSFPVREIQLRPEDPNDSREGTWCTIATDELQRLIITDHFVETGDYEDGESQAIDESIFFYVEDMEELSLPVDELSKLVLSSI